MKRRKEGEGREREEEEEGEEAEEEEEKKREEYKAHDDQYLTSSSRPPCKISESCSGLARSHRSGVCWDMYKALKGQRHDYQSQHTFV